MKVLHSWLREFAPFDAPVAALADTMSDLGMAVESITSVGGGLDGVIVARVLALRPHPGADRVQLVDVDAGDGEALQVVCGAFNMAEGDLVPLATVGAVLPGDFEIARRKVRGEWSNGMLCAPDELGLPGGHDGILVLPPRLEPGARITEALGTGADVLFELEINANRPDAMSVAGVARDLAARMGLPFALPDLVASEGGADGSVDGAGATVEVLAPDVCGRFVARALRDVRIGPSPAHVAARLAWTGMRPINAVVDASNYVMLELGQPTHPYDLGRLGGRGLRVRRAREGERLVTLDDVPRALVPDDLLICDALDEPVGIAGVMGGAAAEIDEATTEVLLEAAWFQPMAVARTSKRLNLRTEASARFERGCDPEVLERAADRFVELVAGAAGAAPPVPAGSIVVEGEVPPRPRPRLRVGRLNAILGTDLDEATVRGLLEPIGFRPEPAGGGDLDVTVPSWRPDSATEIDVIEEVARHHGYARIPASVPSAARFGQLTPFQRDRRLVRQVLAGAGVDEAWNSPFLAPGDLARSGLPTESLELANPLAVEESRLRTSLLPGMLRTLAYNASHRLTGVALFELGHVFRPPADGERLPDEREALAVALGGRDARDAAGTWLLLADALQVEGASMEAGTAPGLHPTRTALIKLGGAQVGVVGEVDPQVLADHALGERVGWIELDLGALLRAPHGEAPHRPVSRYPSSDVDLAFVVADDVPAAAVAGTLRAAGGDLLVDLRLFDVYRGSGVPEGARSLAFSLRFQAADRTLTDDETARARAACIEAVESAHGATLRG